MIFFVEMSESITIRDYYDMNKTIFAFAFSLCQFTHSDTRVYLGRKNAIRGGHGADIWNFKDIRDRIRSLRIIDFLIRFDS